MKKRKLSDLSRLLHFAAERNYITMVPPIPRKGLEEKERKRVMSYEEEEQGTRFLTLKGRGSEARLRRHRRSKRDLCTPANRSPSF